MSRNIDAGDWCGGLSQVDRSGVLSSVLAFLRAHHPNVPLQRLSDIAFSIEQSSFTESACPTYYSDAVVARLYNANVSLSVANSVPSATAPSETSVTEHPLNEQLSTCADWRRSLTLETRNKILRYMVRKVTACNLGTSPQAIINAVAAFETCAFFRTNSCCDYLKQLADEIYRCEHYHTLPVLSADVPLLLQQWGIQPHAPQTQTSQPMSDNVPVPAPPTGPQNIMNMEPGELLSSLFEKPNWKDLLTPADRHTVVRFIFSKLTNLNLSETLQETYQRAISCELDAYTKAETGRSYLMHLKDVSAACLQPERVSEARTLLERNDERNGEDT
ncbi:unnamed protein product [Agarophyton chilense]